MKIKGYDESANSLVVSFASDENSKSIDEYTALAYNPISMFPDVTDPQEILKRIATSGIVIAEQQKLNENLAKNPAMIEAFKNIVGQTLEYNIADILPAPVQVTPPADEVIDTVQI